MFQYSPSSAVITFSSFSAIAKGGLHTGLLPLPPVILEGAAGQLLKYSSVRSQFLEM